MIPYSIKSDSHRSTFWTNRFRRTILECCLGLLAMAMNVLLAQDPPPQPEQSEPAKPLSEVNSPVAPEPGVIPDGVSIPTGTTAPPAIITPAAIEQPQPSFFVHVELDRASREYYDGEQITVKIRCEVDAYLYVLYTQVDGRTYVVFPNSGAPLGKVLAKQAALIPAEKDLFRWKVSAPFGKEQLKVIASKVRIPALEKPEMRQKHATHLPQTQIEQVVDQIKTEIPRDQWSETSITLTTVAGINPQSPRFGKRHGVFFSVPFQLSTKLVAEAFKDSEPTANLGVPTVIDALLMQKTLSHTNALDSSVAFPNPNPANLEEFLNSLPVRDVIKETITKTLPDTVKAGDTVMIYFSGHGSTFQDARHGNSKRSYLVPCDIIGIDELLALRKLKLNQHESFNQYHARRLEYVEKLLADEKLEFDFPDGEKWKSLNRTDQKILIDNVNSLLIEKTAITCDEFNHWLQSLSHCRVIVLLDACMSGGFANTPDNNSETKGVFPVGIHKSRTEPEDFQFIQPQLERLKDLGDVNTAGLFAARHDEPSLQWRRRPINKQTPEAASIILSDIYKQLFANEELIRIGFIEKTPPAYFSEAEPCGIFTFYMAQTLLSSTGTIDVEKAGRECARAMEQYFNSDVFKAYADKVNQEGKNKKLRPIAPHHPKYFDHCQPKALLKL